MARSFLTVGVCILHVCVAGAEAGGPAGANATGAIKSVKSAPVDVGKRMEREVKDFAFSGTFVNALQQIAIAGDVKFAVDWRALEAVKVWKDTAVAFKADRARVEQLLDVALARAGGKGLVLGWYVSGEFVHVTTQRLALARHRQQAVAAVTRPRSAVRSIDFQEATLGDVVSFFRELTGANFYVNWKALAVLNVTRDSPVTLKLRNASVSRVLDLITEQLAQSDDKMNRIYWVIDDGIVHISTGTALNSRVRTRMYDLGDLMGTTSTVTVAIGAGGAAARQMARPSTTTINNRDNSRGRTTVSTETSVLRTGSGLAVNTIGDQATSRTLVNIVKDSVGEDMWEPSGRGSVRIIRNQLVITQSLLGFKLMEQSLRKFRQR